MMKGKTTDMSALPKDIIVHILSLTSPKDACRLSILSHEFKSAVDCDVLWKSFLPPDINDILSGSALLSSLNFTSNKEMFFYLCDHPILIDNGKKCFSLDKWTGKKCYMIAPDDMFISWINSPHYWRWITDTESRFCKIPKLLVISRLEMRGNINTSLLSSNTQYAAYLVFKMDQKTRCGFDEYPAEVSIRVIGDKKQAKLVCMDPFIEVSGVKYFKRPEYAYEDMLRLQRSVERKDGWFELELGEYFNGVDACDLEIDLMEVKGGVIKSGIIVQGIEIRPKGD